MARSLYDGAERGKPLWHVSRRASSAALERDVEHPCLRFEPHSHLRPVAPNADRSDVVNAHKREIHTEEVFAGLHHHRVARPTPEMRKIDSGATIRISDDLCLGGLDSSEVQAVGERNHVAREAVATHVRALPRASGSASVSARASGRPCSAQHGSRRPLVQTRRGGSDTGSRPGSRSRESATRSRSITSLSLPRVARWIQHSSGPDRIAKHVVPVASELAGLRIRRTRTPSDRSMRRSSAAIPRGRRASAPRFATARFWKSSMMKVSVSYRVRWADWDLPLGMVDASVVAAAERFGLNTAGDARSQTLHGRSPGQRPRSRFFHETGQLRSGRPPV
jgi:hypothetical protein